MPSGLVYAGCMLHLSWLIDFQGTGSTSKQVILDDTLVGTPFIINAVGMNANIKLWGDKKTIRYAASNLLYALPSGQTSDVTPAAGLSSAITTITSANYITSAHSWRLRTISPTDDQWQLLDWTAWVEFP
jgi:FlaG/FlaF family flagellin (archaellin)